MPVNGVFVILYYFWFHKFTNLLSRSMSENCQQGCEHTYEEDNDASFFQDCDPFFMRIFSLDLEYFSQMLIIGRDNFKHLIHTPT